ncbi:MAG: ribbon-helix-helix protein, CopG family [Kineosporiaceae bacterium]|nr:ribbon-helix-helix protein, CopG family [Kineosporiaceae bacterium]MBK6873322.1 ribbon-helix-helix protein, CopG family [Kineosporiaceae bacterium]MBK7622802.1 ribbon-helix-helix protein, CopG family [Kineosporiaceae bacterium]MBK8078778.1 ribbon-helix-helix protein, CopG family [Kineosporiaceae bacterium]
MANVLIRNIDEDDLARLDELAARAGLSRNEFLLRHLQQAAHRVTSEITAADFDKFADLADDDVMRGAWS